ncbi:SDR family oxidoreductase [Bacillus capparidis]|uniref:NAD(P)-dependent dehydrogenase (Short-subunit alcohol dehydrogenase family) n=1 Tax=Bacillus capparidis TaxID=1840411 RepID=A0ABS4CRX7_9BACI|nr:SDR family oxidoreductase [Bacillus capparidis]MBP1080328.1 NAD(P)-dependent dehydrogenase (short-subunit alcohol dehydrogenase family) [Bacillus capparidis]MED1094190.1 SDR family oxidoreductase [Bacillus capparidis]
MNNNKKAVIITGAAGGIGQVLALEYAKEGFFVLSADVNQEGGQALEEKIYSLGLSCRFIKTDAADEEQVKRAVNQAISENRSLYALINNVGKGIWKSPLELELSEWNDVLSTNLTSVFLFSKEAAKIMRKQEEGGAIVNMASTRGLMSEPDSESYAASKGGILAITHALAASLSSDGIVVNSISPGWIETGDYSKLRDIDHSQHFSQRVGLPMDIYKACKYLTDPENRFVTGTNLIVDGGMTKKMIYEE